MRVGALNLILVPCPKQQQPTGTPGKKPPAGVAASHAAAGAAAIAKALGIGRASVYRVV
jgi:hypothetical protein